MKIIQAIFERDKPLAVVGSIFFLLSAILGLASIFNEVEVLGLNSLYKPLKFGISNGIFCWTMAYFS